MAANSGLAFAAFEETSTPPPPSSFAASLLRVYFIYLFCEFFLGCLPPSLWGLLPNGKFFASFSSLKFSGAQQFSGLLEKLTARACRQINLKRKSVCALQILDLRLFANRISSGIRFVEAHLKRDLTPPLPFPYFLLIIIICLAATFVAKQFIRIPASLFIRLFTLTRPRVLCPCTCLSHVPHIWISDVILATGAFLLSPPFVWQPRWFVATEKVANGNWISPDVIYDVCLSMPEYFANISLHDFHVTMPINHTQRWKGVEMKYPWYVSFN